MMDFDDVLTSVGEMGTYQWRLFILMCIPASLPSAMALFSHIFISAVPEHHCRPPELPEHTRKILLGGLSAVEEYPELVNSLFLPWDSGRGRFQRCLEFDINASKVIDQLTLPLTTFAGEDNLFLNLSTVKGFVANQNWPTVRCRNGWLYDQSVYTETLVTKFDVVCDSEWLVSCAQSVFYIGGIIGNVLFCWLADVIGRRPAFLWVNALMVFCGVVAIVPPTYGVYIVLRFLMGFTVPTVYQIAFLIAVEVMGASHRSISVVFMHFGFALGMMLFAVNASFLPHWRVLQTVSWLPCLLLLAYYWLVPESARWLISKGRMEEAEQIVQKIARTNGKVLPENFLKSKLDVADVNDTDEIKKRAGSICSKVIDMPAFALREILSYPRVMRRMVTVAIIWTFVAMVYTGMSFGVPSLAASAYVAFFLSGLAELPGLLVAWTVMDRIGRRNTLLISILLGGALSFGTAYVPEDAVWLRISVPTLAKLSISSSFAIVYMFAGELFPTDVRGFALGFASTSAGIGLCITPYVLFLGTLYGDTVPFIIFGILAILGGILLLTLPETLNARLPASLFESEHFDKFCAAKATKKASKEATTGDRRASLEPSPHEQDPDHGVERSLEGSPGKSNE